MDDERVPLVWKNKKGLNIILDLEKYANLSISSFQKCMSQFGPNSFRRISILPFLWT